MYSKIVSQFKRCQDEKIPISDIARTCGFEQCDTKEKDEVFRAVLEEGENVYIVSIVSTDNDRTFQIRPDLFHNHIYCYRDNEIVKHDSYVYEQEV